MSCDVGKATEGLENEFRRRWSDGKIGEWAELMIRISVSRTKFAKELNYVVLYNLGTVCNIMWQCASWRIFYSWRAKFINKFEKFDLTIRCKVLSELINVRTARFLRITSLFLFHTPTKVYLLKTIKLSPQCTYTFLSFQTFNLLSWSLISFSFSKSISEDFFSFLPNDI